MAHTMKACIHAGLQTLETIEWEWNRVLRGSIASHRKTVVTYGF